MRVTILENVFNYYIKWQVERAKVLYRISSINCCSPHLLFIKVLVLC